MRATPLLGVLVGLTHCGLATAQDKEPDFKMTAKEFSESFRKDSKAAAAKYNGKRIELTGKIFRSHCNFPGRTGGISLLATDSDRPLTQLSTAVACVLTPEESQKYQELCELARGQEVTIRGYSKSKVTSELSDCEFVKVGPNPARVLTVAQVNANLRTDALRKKLVGLTVVARARVLKAEEDGTYVYLTVTDPQRKTAQVSARTDTVNNEEWKKELLALKPGTSLIIMFDVEADPPAGVRFENLRILEKPPEGLKKK